MHARRSMRGRHAETGQMLASKLAADEKTDSRFQTAEATNEVITRQA